MFNSSETRYRYTVAVPNPESHLAEVTLEIDGASDLAGAEAKELTVKMAAWCPGSYLVRDYARFVRDIRAADESGRPLAIRKTSKHAWRVEAGSATKVRINYEVYGFDLTVRTNHIDSTHAFLHGPATFLYLDELRDQPCEVALNLPNDRGWSVATGLDESGSTYRAANLDTLLDCPLHLGVTETRSFVAAGKPFELAVWGSIAPGKRDLDDLIGDLTAIVEAHAARFGGMPLSRYSFILMLAPKAYGGLEHKNSSANLSSSFAFATDKSYYELLELLSHEFFHVWNGKRIYPAALSPFDYERENYTRCLWVMEGLTSYYDRYTLLQTGRLPVQRYFEKLAGEWGRMHAIPGRHRHSLESSSFDAWIKLYKPDPSNLNTTVSYYLKGGLVATTLELWIRRMSEGKRSLADVLTTLWRQFGAQARGYPEDVEGIFSEACGLDMGDVFSRWIVGVEDPDLAHELSHLGLALSPPIDSDDEAAFLGVQTGERPLKATGILDDSPAFRAGLCPGDELIALDRHRIGSAPELRSRIEARKPGDHVEVALFRAGSLSITTVELATAPARVFQIATAQSPSEEQKARYQDWLGQPWPSEPLLVSATNKRWT